jgi:16S rRNA (uracil1498-N3)-methyltransferase
VAHTAGAAPPSAAAHAFVADLAAPSLGPEDSRHLERVLRLRPGEAVTVSDGDGRWRTCAWRAGGDLEPTGPVVEEPGPAPTVTVGFALTKGERPEWVVQKLTEVGVDVIVPFRAIRSVVRWDVTKAAAQVERWRRVAREAAMQSRRVRLPLVAEMTGFADLVGALGPAAGLAAPGGAAPSLDRPALLVGPEGGWDPAELAAGPPLVGLGPTVLRAETACVAAGIVLCGLRSGIIRTVGG